jgi:hypothetical protein
MELNQFEIAVLKLNHLFKLSFFEEGAFGEDVIVKTTDFWVRAFIIAERIEEDVSLYKRNYDSLSKSLKNRTKANIEESKKYLINLQKIDLDISDFYIYTRQFLDALTVGIKLTLIRAGNKEAQRIEHSLSCLLNSNKMCIYKNTIDQQFFSGLEEHLIWASTLRDSRDGLVHFYNYLVFTDTNQGEVGNGTKKQRGFANIRSIIGEVQTAIDNMTALLEYIYENLPKVAIRNLSRKP